MSPSCRTGYLRVVQAAHIVVQLFRRGLWAFGGVTSAKDRKTAQKPFERFGYKSIRSPCIPQRSKVE